MIAVSGADRKAMRAQAPTVRHGSPLPCPCAPLPLLRPAVLILREVTAVDTAALRRQVLRGGRPVPLPGDGDPAFHLGLYDGDVLVGTGNVRREPAPWAPEDPAWRLRGMATAPDRRSQGVGATILEGLTAHCRAEGGGLLWCHARTPAQRFYERAGFVPIGEPWVDPEIGPHVRMWIPL